MKAATELTCAPKGAVAISIHAAREGGDIFASDWVEQTGISIHAAREGGDEALRIVNRIVHISIHAAREGGDQASAYRLL